MLFNFDLIKYDKLYMNIEINIFFYKIIIYINIYKISPTMDKE
jgi:hypothetical protein